MLVAEAIQVKVIDHARLLAVNQVEGGLCVPIWCPMKHLLQHLNLNMTVNFCLEVVGHRCFNGWMQALAMLNVHLICLPLAGLFPERGVIARQYELEELVVGETAAVV